MATYCRLPTRYVIRPLYGRAEIRLPQQRSRARVERLKIPFASPREQHVRGRRQNAAVCDVGHVELPLLLARPGVERDDRAVASSLGPRVDWRSRESWRTWDRPERPRSASGEVLPCVDRLTSLRKCSRSLPTPTRRRPGAWTQRRRVPIGPTLIAWICWLAWRLRRLNRCTALVKTAHPVDLHERSSEQELPCRALQRVVVAVAIGPGHDVGGGGPSCRRGEHASARSRSCRCRAA